MSSTGMPTSGLPSSGLPSSGSDSSISGPSGSDFPGAPGSGGEMPSGSLGGISWSGIGDLSDRNAMVEQQMRYFAAGIVALMGIFIASHWLRVVFNKLSPTSRNPIRSTSRIMRNAMVRKVPGFTSSGHVVVFAAYLAINLAITFTNVDIDIHGIANRCGWVLTANFVLVMFLSLKNTPLAVLSAYSYERLNILHQISGYTAFVYLIIHAAMYAYEFLDEGLEEFFQMGSMVAGIVGAFGFLLVILSAAIVRFFWYELFYVLHILGFLMALIGGCYHQPNISSSGVIMFYLIAGIWGLDRIIRLSKLAFNSVNNHATIEPLPHGGTKIILSKKPYRAIPGKHCFVWIPKVRLFETHPFTIAGTEPMEFVVNAYDGFTRDLHKYAVANPGAKLMTSVDGPYGTFPDPMTFDKVVLIAGGSGATFTFGLAVNMLERMGAESTKNITFIWAVKKHDNLSWFAQHLETLRTHPHSPKVKTDLYVTTANLPGTVESSDDENHLPNTAEKSLAEQGVGISINTDTVNDSNATADPEKDAVECHGSRSSQDSAHSRGHDLKFGRPDAATIIREAVSSTPSTQRVLVAACGPEGLMRVVRDTTASLIRGDGPGVELHVEEFGW